MQSFLIRPAMMNILFQAMTLDGKKAGLQRAADLKGEMETLRKREREKFQRLDASVSGTHVRIVELKSIPEITIESLRL